METTATAAIPLQQEADYPNETDLLKDRGLLGLADRVHEGSAFANFSKNDQYRVLYPNKGRPPPFAVCQI